MQLDRRTVLVSGAALAGGALLDNDARAAEVASTELPKGAVILVATVKAKAGQDKAVKEALQGLLEPTRKEAGCIAYLLHQAADDPTQFMFYEQWASKETLDAHSKSAHLQALGPKIKDKTEGAPAMVFYQMVK